MRSSPTSFFFYRPGALGDTLLCAPLLAALRTAYPGARLALAAHAGAGGLLRASGLLDLAFDQDDLRLLGLFAEDGPGGGLVAALGAVDVAVGWLADPEGVVASNLRRVARRDATVAPSRPRPDAGLHVASHLAATLARVGIGPLSLPSSPLLAAPAAEMAWARECLSRLPGAGRPVVAVHPGSGSPAKNWHAAGYVAVIEALAGECAILLIAGPADGEAAAAVAAGAPASATLFRDLPLPRLAALLAECAIWVGNDSGIGHLAALLGLPVVSLFGPTDPALWRPWGERVRVLSWAAGPAALSPATVVGAVRELLAPEG